MFITIHPKLIKDFIINNFNGEGITSSTNPEELYKQYDIMVNNLKKRVGIIMMGISKVYGKPLFFVYDQDMLGNTGMEYNVVEQTDMLHDGKTNTILEKFASDIHEEWRNGWIKSNNGQSVPRIKKNKDNEDVNINVPFSELDPMWRKENECAALAAFEAINIFPDDEEQGADYIHTKWMQRNSKADYNHHLHVPYQDLPQEEQKKDLVHYRTMKELRTLIELQSK